MNSLNKIYITIIFSAFGLFCFGQGSINTPYSYYGIGEFEISDHSSTKGMGGVGIGIRDNSFINYANPASYNSIDSLCFILDVSFSGNYSKFKSTSTSYNTINGNLKKVAAGFRLSPFWGISAGIVPFTNVGYKVNSEKYIEGTEYTYDITNEGSGGLSKLFIGNSFKLGKHFSIGVNSNLIIGYFDKYETVSAPSLSSNTWETKRQYKPDIATSFDFGTQYTNSLSSKWKYTIGLVGGMKTKLRFREYQTYGVNSYSSQIEEYVDDFNFWIPAFGGFGISTSSYKLKLAVDYKFQQWKNVIDNNKMSYLNNSHHIAIGTQYCPRPYIGKTIFERITYQVGAHFDRSYIKIKGENFDTYALSIGALIPIKKQLSVVGFSIEAGKKGRVDKGIFKENYIQVNLSLNFADIWFQKRRFN